MTNFVAGRILGRYELLLPIARGGMAEVWAARLHGTRGFQKLVAIKTLLAGVIEDDRAEQMFLDEAGLSCRIHHPNIVEVFELGESEGTLYLVMEWIDGEPLSFVLQRSQLSGGLPLGVGVNLIGQACKGLHAAHELTDDEGKALGLVHRDISPQNILVTQSGQVKIVDFGVAKITSRNIGLTQAGEIKGKLAYMAPEHQRGLAIDRRADLFALGVVLYLLTTGRHPFRGETPAETVHNIANKEPLPPSQLVPEYPKALEEVVLRTLRKNPDDRFASASELLEALQQALPEALTHRAEAQSAEYLSQLLAERGKLRRNAIRQALDSSAYDPAAGGLQLTSSAQSGTMGAVISDASVSSPSNDQLTALLAANRAMGVRQTLVGALGAFGIAAVVGSVMLFSNKSTPEVQGGQAAAAVAQSPVPAPLVGVSNAEAPSAVAPPAPLAAEVSAQSAAASAAIIAANTPEKDEAKEKAQRKGTAVRYRAPATPTTAAAPVITKAPENTKSPAPKPGAWDRTGYGGRW